MLCHEDHGEVRGWVLDVGADAPVEALPVPSNLFHGVTVVRCEATEAEALALMQSGDATRQTLSEVAHAMACVPIAEQASWERCRPCRVPSSLFTARRDREGRVTFEDGGHAAIMDGAAWTPELSPDGFVGLYFLWSNGRLELYAACQSYLPLACAEFARMAFRLHGRCHARFVAQSEEAQWLRMACARNRARVLAKVCAAVGVRAPLIDDYCGMDRAPMAMALGETLHHDLLPLRDGRVRVLNYCCVADERGESTLCCMAPWEGLWLVRGGTGGEFCPTATPRLGARVRPFSFASAPPRDSRVMCDWKDEDDEADVLLSRMALSTREGLCVAQEEAGDDAQAEKKAKRGDHNNNEVDDADMVRAAYRRALLLHPPVAEAPTMLMHEATTTTTTTTSTLAAASELHPQYMLFDESVVRRLGWTRGVVRLLPFGVVNWRLPSSGAI